MSETRLGVTLEGRDLLSAKLKEAEANVRTFAATLKEVETGTQGLANASDELREAVIRESEAGLAASRMQVESLRAQIDGLERATVATERFKNTQAGIDSRVARIEGLEQDLQGLVQRRQQPTYQLVQAAQRSQGRAGLDTGQEERLAGQISGLGTALERDAAQTARSSQREFEKNRVQDIFADSVQEHVTTAQQRFESPFTSTGTAQRLGSDSISESQLRGVSTELERQLALYRQLGLSQSQYASEANAQLQTRLSVIRAENEAMRRAERDRVQAQQEAFKFSQQIAEQSRRVSYERSPTGELRVRSQEAVEQEKRLQEEIRRTVTERNRAELERIQSQRLAQAATRPALDETTAATIDRVTGVSQAARISQEELEAAFARTSRGARAAGGSMQAFHRDAIGAQNATSTLGFILSRTAVEFGEMARHARGQQISSFFSTLRRLGGMGAVGATLPIAGIIGTIELSHVTQQMGELAEKTINAAAAAGLSVQEYSLLQRTLQLVSGDANHIVTVFGTMSQGIEEALSGTGGPKAGAFAQILGPGWAQELTKDLNNPMALLDQLRQRFQALGPSIETTELYRRALGRGFQELMPIIRLTQQEWDRYTQSAQASGSVMDAQTAQALAKVAIESHRLGEEFAGLGIAIARVAGGTGIITFLATLVSGLREATEAAAGFLTAQTHIADIHGAVGRRVPGPQPEAVPSGHMEIIGGRWRRWVPDRPGETGGVDTGPQQTPEDIQAQSEMETRRGRTLGVTPPTKETYTGSQLYASKEFYERGRLEQELNKRVEMLTQASQLEQKQYQLQIANAGDNLKAVEEIERKKAIAAQKAVEEERKLREQAVSQVRKYEDTTPGAPGGAPEAVERMESKTSLQQKEVENQIQATQKLRQLQREDYEKFADNERLKIQSARGNWAQIASVYQEWINTITAKYPQLVKEFETVQRDMVRASQEASDKLISDRIRSADTQVSILQSQARITELSKETQLLSQPGNIDRTANISAMRQELVELQTAAAQEISIYQDIADTANATAEQKIEALDKAARVAEETAGKEINIAHRIAEEQKRAAEESSKVFVEFFDKAGSAVDSLLDAAIFRTKTRQQAFHDFFLELDKSILHSFESVGSRLAGQGLAKLTGTQIGPGKGLGDVLGSLVGKAFGLEEKPEAQAGVIAAQNATTSQVQAAKEILAKIQGILDQQKAQNSQVQQTLGQTVSTGGLGQSFNLPNQDQALDLIMKYESGGRNIYNLQGSGASGLYQMTRGTWRDEAPKLGVSLQQYPEAINAPSDVQRAVAGRLYQERGFQPWTDYNPQLRQALARGEGGFGSRTPTEPVPVIVTNPQQQMAQMAIPSGNLTPGGAVMPVDVTRVAGSEVATPGILPTVSPDLRTPISPVASPSPPVPDSLRQFVIGPSGIQAPELPQFQQGGLTPPNSSDTVLAWLTPGERVLNLRETGEYHRQFGSKGILGFQEGGIADQILGPSTQQYMSSASTPPSISASIDPSIALLKAGDKNSPEFQQAMSIALGMGPGALRLEGLIRRAGADVEGAAAHRDVFETYWSKEQLKSGSGVPQGGLSPDEFEALAFYQTYGYKLINPLLRTGQVLPEDVMDFATLLQGVTSRSIITEPMTVYRGGIPRRLIPKEGNIGADPGFMSTSTSLATADYFREFTASPVEMALPAGMRGLEFGKIPGLSDFEKEVLLPSRTRYRSLGESPDPGLGYSFIGIPQYQSGGLAPVKQGAFESVPITTESRGFLTPHLVEAYPQPKIGPLLAILGIGTALTGAAALLSSQDKDAQLAKRLLATPDTPGGTEVTSRTTTPLPSGWTDYFAESGDWSSGHFGGIAGQLPGFQKGGVSKDILSRLRSDEVPAILLRNERVLNPQQTREYDSLPKFHSGGFVWPAFQTGGTVDSSSPTYSPAIQSGDSSDSKALVGTITSLSSGLTALSQDVSKVSSGFTALEKATSPVGSTTSGFISELKSTSSALSAFTSILNTPKQIAGAIGGIGGFVGGIGSLLGLEGGGIIPSAQGGMIVGGLPGGMLSLLHPQEMVLPANISNFVQGAAANYTGAHGGTTDFSSGDIHNTFNISGVVNSHDVGRLFMQHFEPIMKAFQRGSRNNFEGPR